MDKRRLVLLLAGILASWPWFGWPQKSESLFQRCKHHVPDDVRLLSSCPTLVNEGWFVQDMMKMVVPGWVRPRQMMGKEAGKCLGLHSAYHWGLRGCSVAKAERESSQAVTGSAQGFTNCNTRVLCTIAKAKRG